MRIIHQISCGVAVLILTGQLQAQDNILVDSERFESPVWKRAQTTLESSGTQLRFPDLGVGYCLHQYISGSFKKGHRFHISGGHEDIAANNLSVYVAGNGFQAIKEILLPSDQSKLRVSVCRFNNKSTTAFNLRGLRASVTDPAVVLAPEVYPGCPSFIAPLNTIEVDSAKGQDLNAMFKSKQILPGMKVILKGSHGALLLNKYSHPHLVSTSEWIEIVGEGAQIVSVDIRDVEKIKLTNVNFTGRGPKNYIAAAGAKNLIFNSNSLVGGTDSSSWELTDWMTVPSGINSDNSKCVAILSNKLINLRGGITASTRATVSADTQINVLIKGNQLRNLSADFFRPLGSNVTIENNQGIDGYASTTEGDANHDDFVQGFAYPLGIEYSNVKVINNFFQDVTDPARRFISRYQGISVFDGLYTHFLIKNNTVIAGAYHGISMYWGKNGVIENNTLLANLPDYSRKLAIRVFKSKQGDLAENVIVRNNLANIYSVNAGMINIHLINNATVIPQDAAKHYMSFDPVKGIYDLRFQTTSPYYGAGIGAQ